MILNDLADGLLRRVDAAQDGLNEMLFEPVIRLGVTGLSRAGKTVFITGLVANLLDHGRMTGLAAVAEGRFLGSILAPQPDDDVPRFAYEAHMAALRGNPPAWPASTRAISQLRLTLTVRPSGMFSGMTGPRRVHLDIYDYPGEWLLDLPLLDMTFAQWSASALEAAEAPARASHAAPWVQALGAVDPAGALEEPRAQGLAAGFTAYLDAMREAGLSACAPGRFLMPGDLEGSPALTFCPLWVPAQRAGGDSLYRAFERRFEAYKRLVIKPFYRDHFMRLDRQIVLVDVLGALHAGPRAIEDLRLALAEILRSFRPGTNSWLGALLGQKRIERILFAATKADHLHQSQHGALSAITEALLRDARDAAQHAGAETAALALAALRSTVEVELPQAEGPLPAVAGRLLESGKRAAMYPGTLPQDPAHLLAPAGNGAARWLDRDYHLMRFAPPELSLAPGDGPPHIRLDKALQFLIGDRLA